MWKKIKRNLNDYFIFLTITLLPVGLSFKEVKNFFTEFFIRFNQFYNPQEFPYLLKIVFLIGCVFLIAILIFLIFNFFKNIKDKQSSFFNDYFTLIYGVLLGFFVYFINNGFGIFIGVSTGVIFIIKIFKLEFKEKENIEIKMEKKIDSQKKSNNDKIDEQKNQVQDEKTDIKNMNSKSWLFLLLFSILVFVDYFFAKGGFFSREVYLYSTILLYFLIILTPFFDILNKNFMYDKNLHILFYIPMFILYLILLIYFSISFIKYNDNIILYDYFIVQVGEILKSSIFDFIFVIYGAILGTFFSKITDGNKSIKNGFYITITVIILMFLTSFIGPRLIEKHFGFNKIETYKFCYNLYELDNFYNTGTIENFNSCFSKKTKEIMKEKSKYGKDINSLPSGKTLNSNQ